MATTLPYGAVVPNPDEQISKSGVEEIRTLGASLDSGVGAARQLATDVGAESLARDAVLADQIAGMEGMTYVGAWSVGVVYRINDVVTHGGDSWARLTAGSTGVPGDPAHWGLVARKGDGGGFGALAETAVPGLYDTVDNGIEARLATLERDTRRRNIREDLVNASAISAGGRAWIRRIGARVELSGYDLAFAASGTVRVVTTLPLGFRPIEREGYTLSISPFANVEAIVMPTGLYLYEVPTDGGRIRAAISWLTEDPWPTALPGTPA